MKVIEKKDLCVWLVLCQLHRTPSVFNSFLGLDCFFFFVRLSVVCFWAMPFPYFGGRHHFSLVTFFFFFDFRG